MRSLTDLDGVYSCCYAELLREVQIMLQTPSQCRREAAYLRLCLLELAAISEYRQGKAQRVMVGVTQTLHTSGSERCNAKGTLLEQP